MADYLVSALGFQRLALKSQATTTNSTQDVAERVFAKVEELLDFVTPRWRQPWVLTSPLDEANVDLLMLRPFFLLLSVDAPIGKRWQRYQTKHGRNGGAMITNFDEFVLRNDEEMYEPHGGLSHLLDRAQLRLLNSSDSLQQLHDGLRSLDLSNQQRLRPSWDQYFMQLADLAAQRSNCMKRRVGCVVVRDKRVISTGYNGTPRYVTNCNEGGCKYLPIAGMSNFILIYVGPRCNGGQGGGMGLTTCLCIHAEENALLEAGRERIREGASLYCNTSVMFPCRLHSK